MKIDECLRNTVQRLELMYESMGIKAGNIEYIDDGKFKRIRYDKQNEALVCYLKGVKSVSTLNACLVLLNSGYVQEIGALCRIVDDMCNEIFYLLVPLDGVNYCSHQKKFVKAFFQEEFDLKNTLNHNKRESVQMKKIHAAFARLGKNFMNPSDSQGIANVAYKVLSGYVHGAYPHIMELFGGRPFKAYMSGMLGTPRIEEWQKQIVIYVHRLIMVTALVARKIGSQELEIPIRKLLEDFESTTGVYNPNAIKEFMAKKK